MGRRAGGRGGGGRHYLGVGGCECECERASVLGVVRRRGEADQDIRGGAINESDSPVATCSCCAAGSEAVFTAMLRWGG